MSYPQQNLAGVGTPSWLPQGQPTPPAYPPPPPPQLPYAPGPQLTQEYPYPAAPPQPAQPPQIALQNQMMQNMQNMQYQQPAQGAQGQVDATNQPSPAQTPLQQQNLDPAENISGGLNQAVEAFQNQGTQAPPT